MRRNSAFTIIELLIVVLALILLVAMLLPSLQGSREMARKVLCLSNMRQLTAACIAYAHDNRDILLAVDTSNVVGVFPGSSPQQQFIPALHSYAPDARIFSCPSDPRLGANSTNILSYEVNDYLNGTWPALSHARRITEIQNASEVFALIEEYDTNPQGLGGASCGFVVMPSPSYVWIDWPGIFHQNGTCISFLDGHAEFWGWSDPRTFTLSAGNHRQNVPNDADIRRLQAVLGTTK